MFKKILKSHIEKRQYIRHPAEISIEYSMEGMDKDGLDVTRNISYGGLCFRSHLYMETGTILSLKFPTINPRYQVQGKVVWCSRKKGYTEIGVQFLDENDAYRAQMIEEICELKSHQMKTMSTSEASPAGISTKNYKNLFRKTPS